jgi:hypothetical protein
MYWTQVIVDRLTTVAHVYGNPPHPDVFMPERERQAKLSLTVDVLRHLHVQTDQHELHTPQDNVTAAEGESRFITALQPLYVDILRRLPTWSDDMQKLLKSPWFDIAPVNWRIFFFVVPMGARPKASVAAMPKMAGCRK